MTLPLQLWARKIAKRVTPRNVRAARASLLARRASWRKQKQLLATPGREKGAAYLRAHGFRHALDYPLQAQLAQQSVRRRWGKEVAGGPFAGMKYGDEAFCSAYSPKILGCYEAELHPALEVLLEESPRLILNIGAAKGYYAVGLARYFSDATVYAFEIDASARELCAGLAELNGVSERVNVRPECTLDELRSLPLEGALILSDCEGCEFDLLRPGEVPGLRECDILVELHDCFDPRVTPALRERFDATHDIAIIDSVACDASQFAIAQFLPERQRQIAVDDGRAEWLQWALMTVKTQAQAPSST